MLNPKLLERTHESVSVDFQALLQEKMREAIRYTLIAILEEVEAVVKAAPYQRTVERRDYRNGYYTRTLGTSVGVITDLPVPRTRKGFQTRLFEQYQRRQAQLDEAICQMFIQGVSTARVGEVLETMTGSKPSPSTVSRVFHTLEEEHEAWKSRPLQSRYLYAFADGTYFTIIYEGRAARCPCWLLWASLLLVNARYWLSPPVSERPRKPGKTCWMI